MQPRPAAVRAGVERLLRDEREHEIAQQYRRATAPSRRTSRRVEPA